jgi:hypothetical protein
LNRERVTSASHVSTYTKITKVMEVKICNNKENSYLDTFNFLYIINILMKINPLYITGKQLDVTFDKSKITK